MNSLHIMCCVSTHFLATISCVVTHLCFVIIFFYQQRQRNGGSAGHDSAAAAAQAIGSSALAVQGVGSSSAAVEAQAQVGSGSTAAAAAVHGVGRGSALAEAAERSGGSGSAAADAHALSALRRQSCGCFIDSGSAAAAAQRPAFTSAVQGVGSGSTAAAAV